MFKLLSLLFIVFFLSTNSAFAKVNPKSLTINKTLLDEFRSKMNSKAISKLKRKVLSMSGKAVPTLIKVMKSDKFPDNSRWVATFSLARIMGKRSSPFLVKFLEHPSWVMRMAAMKSLLALKEKKYANQYTRALKDKSFIVRRQALETINRLELKDKAANVWAMLYDKDNYYKSASGSKRSNIIKVIVRTVGDLRFQKAKGPLLTMIQKKKYHDIFEEMDYTLSLIAGKKSPKGDDHMKRRYWKKIAIMSKTI
jgi:HEAT repeat protein